MTAGWSRIEPIDIMMISVIIPAYNIEDCIERCIRSVCAQTYRDLEIIVVDDGSSDRTADIAEELAISDSRIRVIRKENGGTSSARNTGIDNARGEYLGFTDADDFISPDMYEKLVSFIQKERLITAQVCRDEVDEHGNALPMVVTPPDKPSVIGCEDFLRELLLHRGDCSMCTKLTAREAFERHRFPDGELNEDFKIFTEIITDGELFCDGITAGVGSLPDICYHVCYRAGSNTRTSRDTFSRVYKDIVVNADRISELVDNVYPELSEYAVRFGLVQRLDYLLHIPVKMMKRSDDFYAGVVDHMRHHGEDISVNPYLGEDERRKMKILSIAPRTVRSVHRILMKIRGN